MNAVKVPVEYVIATTSDWTMFEIFEGGEWQDLHVQCKRGKERLRRDVRWDSKFIRIDKNNDDEEPVLVSAKCFLNIKPGGDANLQYRITKGDRQMTTVLTSIRGRLSFFMVNNEHDGSNGGTNPLSFESPVNDYIPNIKKEKVFIVHGSDQNQALRLKSFLSNNDIKAIMFDDLNDKGRTIIEQIEYIRDNVSYAFVILTADDVACTREDADKISLEVAALKNSRKENLNKALERLQGRARQNVVFELGWFMGTLGRENVCCLKQKGAQEIPSDISGVLYKEFENKVDERFHEIREEL